MDRTLTFCSCSKCHHLWESLFCKNGKGPSVRSGAWLEDHEEQMEVFYLASYSPELNPDERLNADLKYAMGSRVQVRTKRKLKMVTNEHMTMLEQSPERVKYAA